MTTTAAALSLLSLLAASGALTVDNVTAVDHPDRLAVSVTTSAPVDADDVSAKVAEGNLVVYIQKAKVRPDRETFRSGERTVRVRPRPKYAKLEIPLPADAGCRGPIDLSVTGSSVVASIRCGSGAGKARAEKPVHAVAAAEETDAEETPHAKPLPAAERLIAAAAGKGHGEHEAEPTAHGKAEPAHEAPAREPAAHGKAEPVHPAPIAQHEAAAHGKAEPAHGAAATHELSAHDKPEAAPSDPHTKPAEDKSPRLGRASDDGPSLGKVLLPALLLAGLAFAAWRYGKKRARGGGLIRILETASLGPRRQLIVAQVGEQTLLLAASEAGITLLSPMGGESGGNLQSALAAVSLGATPTVEDDVDVTDEPVIEPDQAGYLARLFSAPPLAGGPSPANDDGVPAPRVSRQTPDPLRETHEVSAIPGEGGGKDRSFEDVLKDTLEDQELRRRLAAGISGKAP